MTRTMYDSVTASHIPRTATMVAGYLSPSRFRWSAVDWALFPHARKVRIAILANVNDGHVLDVEPGDASPRQAPGWVKMRRKAGLATPAIYCNRSTWPEVAREFDRQKVAPPLYWIAQYDNRAQMIPGAIAKQYANPATHGGGHYDLSVVANYWPGVDPKPGALMALTDKEQDELLTKVRDLHSWSRPPANWKIKDQWLPKALSNMQGDLDDIMSSEEEENKP